jgi:hypothetical protein
MMDTFDTTFGPTLASLRARLKSALGRHQFTGNYKVVWDEFEAIIEPLLVEHLVSVVPGLKPNQVQKASSKSVYPDFKVDYRDRLYAIDIKSGESTKDPWYDMGRLDTYKKDHLDKYAAEYCITIKWSGDSGSVRVVDVYVEPTHASVGFNPRSDGIKYRPYDGKLRPKSWTDFDEGKVYWPNIEAFRVGLEKSMMYRRIEYIKAWYVQMDRKARAALRAELKEIDRSNR